MHWGVDYKGQCKNDLVSFTLALQQIDFHSSHRLEKYLNI